jgi:hypothetical protein
MGNLEESLIHSRNDLGIIQHCRDEKKHTRRTLTEVSMGPFLSLVKLSKV